jgi:hypothetical protein
MMFDMQAHVWCCIGSRADQLRVEGGINYCSDCVTQTGRPGPCLCMYIVFSNMISIHVATYTVWANHLKHKAYEYTSVHNIPGAGPAPLL